MKKFITLSSISFAVFALLISPVLAQIETSLDSATELRTEVKSNIIGDVDSESRVEFETSVDSDADSETEIDASLNGKIEKPFIEPFTVSTAGSINSSAQVNSDEDLKMLETSIQSQNSSVSRVEIDSEESEDVEVTVQYRHTGKLFGFIPVTVKSSTTVKAENDSEIEVETDSPWWAIFVLGKTYNNATLEGSLRNNTTIQQNARVNASARAKAEIVEAIIAEIEANATATASVKANI